MDAKCLTHTRCSVKVGSLPLCPCLSHRAELSLSSSPRLLTPEQAQLSPATWEVLTELGKKLNGMLLSSVVSQDSGFHTLDTSKSPGSWLKRIAGPHPQSSHWVALVQDFRVAPL